MMSVQWLDQQLNSLFHQLFGERDERVSGWLLCDSYLPTLSVTVLYLLGALLGPLLMEHRAAFSLQGALLAYNLAVTLLSGYTLQELIRASWSAGYSLQCQGLREAGHHDVRVAGALWWYYVSKLVELLDTVFIILRKRTNQMSFLHVYHHASMLNLWWAGLNWAPAGQSFLGPTINSGIHVLMYSYYGLSAVPSLKPFSLWWKQHLTKAQLIQFILTMLHAVIGIFKSCGFPRGWLLFLIGYMTSLLLLFLNFYIKTYRQRRGLDQDADSLSNGVSTNHSTAAKEKSQ